MKSLPSRNISRGYCHVPIGREPLAIEFVGRDVAEDCDVLLQSKLVAERRIGYIEKGFLRDKNDFVASDVSFHDQKRLVTR